MTAKYDFATLEPGQAQRLAVPEGTEQRQAIVNAKAALAGWRRKALSKAATKRAAAEIERRSFEVLASGAGHIRIKRTDAPAQATTEAPSVKRVASTAKAKGKGTTTRGAGASRTRKTARAA